MQKKTKGLHGDSESLFFFAIIRPFGMAMPYVFTHLITDVARRTEPTGFLVARATGSQFRHVAQSGWILRDTAELVRQAQCGEVSALGNLGTFRQASSH